MIDWDNYSAVQIRLLIAFIPAWALQGCTSEPTPAPPARPVWVATVEFAKQVSHVRYAGEVRPRHEYPLAFQVGGKILERYVEVGSQVKRGQRLAALDPVETQLSEVSAGAQLTAAETELQTAQRELQHWQNLASAGLASPASVTRHKDQVQAAQARVTAARVAQKQSARTRAYTELRADFDGVVTNIDAQAGQVIGSGQTIVTLAREDEKELVINVPENRRQELLEASAINVSLWAKPEHIYSGQLREISPGVDDVLRTYTVKIALRDADRQVGFGMTATADVERAATKATAMLPLTALTRAGEHPAVWIFDPTVERVSLRRVEVDRYDATHATITSGLADGEKVVTAGVHKLMEGQPVRLPEAQL